MRPFGLNTILLLVSTPVDVLTTLAQQLSGLPHSQVMGSGTFLDTVRLRRVLADKFEVRISSPLDRFSKLCWTALQVANSSINAYVLGEHGDSQFVAWSLASIDAVPIDEALPPHTFNRIELAEACKHEGQRIIDTKGAMAFGIGSVVSSICSSIIFDKRDVHPISHLHPDMGCCVSLPVVLGRKGIIKTVPLVLSSEEEARLAHSGKIVRETVQGLVHNS